MLVNSFLTRLSYSEGFGNYFWPILPALATSYHPPLARLNHGNASAFHLVCQRATVVLYPPGGGETKSVTCTYMLRGVCSLYRGHRAAARASYNYTIRACSEAPEIASKFGLLNMSQGLIERDQRFQHFTAARTE